jgi:hypothetical protein
MASAETLWRLYASGQIPKISGLPQTGDRAKSDNVSHLQTDVSALPSERKVRGRFVLTPPESSYQVTPAEIMSSVAPSVLVDRSEAFAELAWRERLAQAARHRLRGGQRGGAGSAGGGVSIQM